MYGNIGFTRRDKSPAHWRGDYELKPRAKQMLARIVTEREALLKMYTAISEDMSLSDEAYSAASRDIRAKLDALIDREDEIRRTNPA